MNKTEPVWLGYARKNGSKGIRNRLLVIYTVKCAEFVARELVRLSESPDVELVGFDSKLGFVGFGAL